MKNRNEEEVASRSLRARASPVQESLGIRKFTEFVLMIVHRVCSLSIYSRVLKLCIVLHNFVQLSENLQHFVTVLHTLLLVFLFMSDD